MKRYDIIIIGGGAVGCAIAYTLGKYNLRTALLERHPDVAMGTSGKNSAVVHAGFNNKPGSLTAKLCVEGNKRFETVCKTLDVPYKRTGKLVVGFNDDDGEIIDQILVDGKKNGCIGLERIEGTKIRELEPSIVGANALFSANTAVFDPFLYTIHLCEAAIQNGVSFYMNNEVVSIIKENHAFTVSTTQDEYSADILINSAGIYADTVAAMAGDSSFTIYPCRGEYFILDTSAAKLINRPVYPAPRKGIGGLGVHLTTTIDGNVLIGPSAEYIDSKEDYASTQGMMDDLFREAQQLLPSLRRNMIIGTYTGIRPKIVPKGQVNYGDFIIEESKAIDNLINLVGIESPGLTASVPIAEMVANIVGSKRKLQKNSRYKEKYQGCPVFADMDIEPQNSLIAANPDYGEVICRCKTITKAEVLQALHNSLGVHTLVSIKNRVHATMGRCQGGYCLTKITEILMNEFEMSPEQIVYRYQGDQPFPCHVK
jgi:glycerol-3-phosphate dehydrogenase